MARDLERESKLGADLRRLIDKYDRAYRAAGRMGFIRWSNVYDALESGEEGAQQELENLVVELLEEAPAARQRRQRERRKEREQEQWEEQATEVDPYISIQEQERRYAGRDVWLYHGTSTALLPTIRRFGLQPDVEERTFAEGTPGYVYLTALYDGSGKGDASFYARAAAGHFGGYPVVLRVIVPFDELEPDEDDADLVVYSYQYRTPYPVTRIMEIGGRKVRS